MSNELYLLLGKMDGKLDSIQDQLATLNARTGDHEKKLADHEAKLAVLDQNTEACRKHTHEINNIKQSLDGRAMMVEQHRENIRKIETLESWRQDHDAQEKGRNKLLDFAGKAAPTLVAVATVIGLHVAFDPPKAIHAQTTTTTSVIAPPTAAPAQVEAAKAGQ